MCHLGIHSAPNKPFIYRSVQSLDISLQEHPLFDTLSKKSLLRIKSAFHSNLWAIQKLFETTENKFSQLHYLLVMNVLKLSSIRIWFEVIMSKGLLFDGILQVMKYLHIPRPDY